MNREKSDRDKKGLYWAGELIAAMGGWEWVMMLSAHQPSTGASANRACEDSDGL